MTIGLHLNDTDNLQYYAFITSCIVSWSWYTLYSLSNIDVLYTDSWSYYTESHTILYLYWLIKLTKVLGETSSRGTREVCLEGRPLVGLDATRDHVFL